MTKTIQIILRVPSQSKPYWINQLQEFANRFNDEIKSIAFGKQDLRGNPSITLFDTRHCVPGQMHFASNKELLSYVQGYNAANNKWDFSRFID